MNSAAATVRKFVRRTTLAPHEYHKHFHKIDEEVIAAVTSPEADRVTPLMSKIYLRLVNAPGEFWERAGVLHFTAREGGGKKLLKASTVLCEYLGVARATLNKALKWMHEQGIIGHFAGKNGVGIRIFLNRALSSIGTRPAPADQKIFYFSRGSSDRPHGSRNEPAFNEPSGYSDSLDKELNPHAPKSGAGTRPGNEIFPDQIPAVAPLHHDIHSVAGQGLLAPSSPTLGPTAVVTAPAIPVEEIIARLRRELESAVKTAATQAAAREHERTREWLDRHGIPKATRVAQKEAFKVLRSHGVIERESERARAELHVGRSTTGDGNGARLVDGGDDGPRTAAAATMSAPPPLTPEQIAELAAACVALREVQGKAINETLREISAESGGWVLPGDVVKVREAAHANAPELAGRRRIPEDSAAE